MLSEVCGVEGLLKSGLKQQRVDRLIEEGITYGQLQNEFLESICKESDLDWSSDRRDMIALLTNKKVRSTDHHTEHASSARSVSVSRLNQPS